MIICVYSSLSSMLSVGFCKSFAKPCMEASGVLNSWDTLEIKSPRRVSIPESSCAILLKFLWRVPYSSEPFSRTLTEKFPLATSEVAILRSCIGWSIVRPTKVVIIVPSMILDMNATMVTRLTIQKTFSLLNVFTRTYLPSILVIILALGTMPSVVI